MPSQQTKIHCLRQCLATFDSAYLSVYDYSHYIVKKALAISALWPIECYVYCIVLIPAAVPAA